MGFPTKSTLEAWRVKAHVGRYQNQMRCGVVLPLRAAFAMGYHLTFQKEGLDWSTGREGIFAAGARCVVPPDQGSLATC